MSLADRIEANVGKWLVITRRFLCNTKTNDVGDGGIFKVHSSEILPSSVTRHDSGGWNVSCHYNLFCYDDHTDDNSVLVVTGSGNVWLDTFQIAGFSELTERYEVKVRCDSHSGSCLGWDLFIVADTEEEALALFVETWKGNPQWTLLPNPKPWIAGSRSVVRE
jgi:hypothetical protein